MIKLIGWLFFFMCPYVAGIIPFLLVGWLFEFNALEYFVGWGIIWFILFVLWFDGSKYQRSL